MKHWIWAPWLMAILATTGMALNATADKGAHEDRALSSTAISEPERIGCRAEERAGLRCESIEMQPLTIIAHANPPN